MAREAWDRERIDPLRHRLAHGAVREHVARYRFAAASARGRVLDAGCGVGYGTLLLASQPTVVEALGVDRDRRAIAHARRHYAAPHVRFACADLLSGRASILGSFSTVVCLEVLEHLSEPERLLGILDQLLAPQGRLIVSTPLGQGRGSPSAQPGHCFQLRREEFTRMLQLRFAFQLYGQKGEMIERWRRGHRYFLMLAVCRARTEC